MGTKTLGDILAERETIAHDMQVSLDEATDPWGVYIERVEVGQHEHDDHQDHGDGHRDHGVVDASSGDLHHHLGHDPYAACADHHHLHDHHVHRVRAYDGRPHLQGRAVFVLLAAFSATLPKINFCIN